MWSVVHSLFTSHHSWHFALRVDPHQINSEGLFQLFYQLKCLKFSLSDVNTVLVFNSYMTETPDVGFWTVHRHHGSKNDQLLVNQENIYCSSCNDQSKQRCTTIQIINDKLLLMADHLKIIYIIHTQRYQTSAVWKLDFLDSFAPQKVKYCLLLLLLVYWRITNTNTVVYNKLQHKYGADI